MSIVNELITNLLEESLKERLIHLENNFTREATELSTLEIDIYALKSKNKTFIIESLKECEVIAEADIIDFSDIIHEPEPNLDKSISKVKILDSNNSLNKSINKVQKTEQSKSSKDKDKTLQTEPSLNTTSVSKVQLTESALNKSVNKTQTFNGKEKIPQREKSIGKTAGLEKEKTMSKIKTVVNLKNRPEETKINEKEKTMTKIKTVVNFKNNLEETKSLVKNKSTLNVTNNTPKKEEPKTPKGEKRSIALTTPDKPKSSKTITKTPTKSNLKDDSNHHSMTRTQTKLNLKDDKRLQSEKSVEKDKSKRQNANINKSNTKVNVNKKESAKNVKDKSENKDPEKLDKSGRKEKTDKETKKEKLGINSVTVTNFVNNAEMPETIPSSKGHLKREDNISATICIETNINDELLTKDDDFLISGMIQDKIEINSPLKLDFSDILDDRWSVFSKYLNRIDRQKLLEVNKVFGKLSMSSIISDYHKEIIENENKIKTLKEKNPIEDLTKEHVGFVLTRGALKAVELLNEGLYSKLFSDSNLPVNDIILTYRIFFQLLNKTNYVSIKDNETFWKMTCEYFIKESNGKLGTMVQNLVKEIDFSNENIYRLSKLCGNNVSKISPNYFSRLCGTTGLFIFLIKDAFEYSGIVVDKKTPISRIYKNNLYLSEILNSKIERLKKIQSTYFG